METNNQNADEIKREAVQFAAFAVDWFEHNGMVEPNKRWTSVKNGETLTTEQLYNKFIEQSKK